MIEFLRRYGLTIIILFVCLGLAVWTWLAFQVAFVGFQSLGLFG